MAGASGNWSGRLRKRHPKENENEKSKILEPAKKQTKPKNHQTPANNNSGQENNQKKSQKRKIGRQVEEKKERTVIKSFHPAPKTIKQRQENSKLIKAFNEDYQDDIFESLQTHTEKFKLVQDWSFSSEGSTSSLRTSSSPRLVLPKLKREDTPVWYREQVKENQINMEEGNSWQHLAYINKQVQSQLKEKRSEKHLDKVSSATSKLLEKESLETSCKEIALMSSSLADRSQEEGEECEEYFSEED